MERLRPAACGLHEARSAEPYDHTCAARAAYKPQPTPWRRRLSPAATDSVAAAAGRGGVRQCAFPSPQNARNERTSLLLKEPARMASTSGTQTATDTVAAAPQPRRHAQSVAAAPTGRRCRGSQRFPAKRAERTSLLLEEPTSAHGEPMRMYSTLNEQSRPENRTGDGEARRSL